jgi:hypothetical protein
MDAYISLAYQLLLSQRIVIVLSSVLLRIRPQTLFWNSKYFRLHEESAYFILFLRQPRKINIVRDTAAAAAVNESRQ